MSPTMRVRVRIQVKASPPSQARPLLHLRHPPPDGVTVNDEISLYRSVHGY